MSSVYHRGKFHYIPPVVDDGTKSMEELFLEGHRQIINALFCKHDIDSSSGNPTPSSESIFPDSSRPSLTPVEGSNPVLEDVNISLNDSISTEIVEDKPSDPLEPELKDSLPDSVKNDFDTAEECELPPIDNPNDHDEIFSDSEDEDSLSCGEIEYVDDDPMEPELEEFLPDFESFTFDTTEEISGNPTYHPDFSNTTYEAFHFDIDHSEETSRGSTTSHAFISLPEYESFCFDEFECEIEKFSNPEYESFRFDLGIDYDPGGILKSEILNENFIPSLPPGKVFKMSLNDKIHNSIIMKSSFDDNEFFYNDYQDLLAICNIWCDFSYPSLRRE
jgi:hypothetical protein